MSSPAGLFCSRHDGRRRPPEGEDLSVVLVGSVPTEYRLELVHHRVRVGFSEVSNFYKIRPIFKR